MADGKKTFNIAMEIDIFSEFSKRPVVTWIKMDPSLKKAIVPIPIKEKLELDPRKWSKSDLENGINAVARYDLKIFAVAATDLHTKISKATKNADKIQEKCEADLLKMYKSTRKDIEKKVSLALEEVEADKGDSKKALKEGKTAFNGMPSKAEIEGIYKSAQSNVATIMSALVAELKKAEKAYDDSVAKFPPRGESEDQKKEREEKERQAALDMEQKRDDAFAEAARKVDTQRSLFNAGKKDLEQAMADLDKLASQLKRNKDLPPEFTDFQKSLESEKGTFLECRADLQAFDTNLGDCTNDLKTLKGKYGKQGRTSDDARARLSRMERDNGRRNKSATTLAKCIVDLKEGFKALERNWK